MHNIEHYTYNENVDKKKVQAELDNYVKHVDWQEGASGLPRPIRWVDNVVYENRDIAEREIEIADKGTWYNCMAVKYKEYPVAKPTKAICELRERIKKQSEAYNKIVKDARVQNRTSDFVGCPKCGSRLKRELISYNHCPLCKTDLRSKTDIDRVEKADKKLKELMKKCDEMEKAESQKLKPVIKWLVKIEYHT